MKLAIVAGILSGIATGAAAATASAPNVLFVCEHGSAKSVVAAAHFNRLAAERGLKIRAVSRGTVPDQEMAPPAVAGLRGDGLAPAEAKPALLGQSDLDAAVRVVTFCELPPELKSAAPVERWEVPPVSVDYAASRTALVERIEKLLRELPAER